MTASAGYYMGLRGFLQYVFNLISNVPALKKKKQGLDVGYIDVVVDYGAPRAKTTPIQRGGRAGRRGQPSVYLLMAEPWVYTASLAAVDPNSSDPDGPISGRLLKSSRKPERAGLAVVQYVRSETCLREMFAHYLGDKSREGEQDSTLTVARYILITCFSSRHLY
jgi:superfamily II DNA helicase RecQ